MCLFSNITVYSNINKTALFPEKSFTGLCNKPTIVYKLSGYPRNGTSVGVPTSGLAHHTMKCTIDALMFGIALSACFIPSCRINPVTAMKGLITQKKIILAMQDIYYDITSTYLPVNAVAHCCNIMGLVLLFYNRKHVIHVL